MNRITPEMVVEAYKETGLKASRKQQYPNGADALEVLAIVQTNSTDKSVIHQYIRGWNLADSFYTIGFGQGFYGGEYVFATELLRLGYEDGQAAWRAVVEAGLVEE